MSVVQYDLGQINTLIYNAKVRIADSSRSRVRDILHQHGFCETTEDRNLEHYLYALQRLRTQLIREVEEDCDEGGGGKSDTKLCLCKEEIEELLDNTRSSIGILCSVIDRTDVEVDSSNYNEWVVQNPDLMTYEEWEKCLYDTALQFKLNPDAITVENLCDQVDVVIEVKKLDCVGDPDIDITKIVCDYDVDLKVDLDRCILDHQIFVEVTKCDLSLEEFIHVQRCGLDIDVLTKAIDCGFDVKVEDSKVQICSGTQVIAQVTPGA